MACSNPFLYNPYKNTETSKFYRYNDFLSPYNAYSIPCGWCLNCRIDKANQLTHRSEYEFIKFGCGAFVTFTYDDYHLFNNMFYDSNDEYKIKASLCKKDCKEFLDNLNKLVHKERKKNGFNPLCNEKYKYIIVGEYGEHGSVFDRPHFHALFFGLDFAFCERLFWRAWQFQGNIQVGSIQNGGIGYVLKYIDKQIFGKPAFYKYDYHHLQRPFMQHSKGFGDGLYKSQLKYINNNHGNYKWHSHDFPVPSYYKNKFKILSGSYRKDKYENYLNQLQQMQNMYNIRPKNYLQFTDEKLRIQNRIMTNRQIKMRQNGDSIFDINSINKEIRDMIYSKSKSRLSNIHDKAQVIIISPQFIKFNYLENPKTL